MKKEGEAALEWLNLILSAQKTDDLFAQRFNQLNKDSKNLYLALRKMILAIDKNIAEKHFKSGVSFRANNKTFVSVSPQQSLIRIYLLYKGKLDDPKQITRSVKGIGTVFAATRDFKIKTKEEMFYTMKLIKQAHQSLT